MQEEGRHSDREAAERGVVEGEGRSATRDVDCNLGVWRMEARVRRLVACRARERIQWRWERLTGWRGEEE